MAEVVKFNLDSWRKWLGELSFEKAAARGLRAGAARAIPVLHTATDRAPKASDSKRSQRGANNTGAFRRAWKVSNVESGVSIFNSSSYAPVVEGGRRKGAKMPPTKPIAQWAQRRAGLSRKEAERLAFVMARAIKARGLKPRNILKDSIPKITKVVLKEVEHELDLELRKK